MLICRPAESLPAIAGRKAILVVISDGKGSKINRDSKCSTYWTQTRRPEEILKKLFDPALNELRAV